MTTFPAEIAITLAQLETVLDLYIAADNGQEQGSRRPASEPELSETRTRPQVDLARPRRWITASERIIREDVFKTVQRAERGRLARYVVAKGHVGYTP